MRQEPASSRSSAASIAFNLLDPVPYGMFVGALIFDAVYDDNAEVLWFKAAAWLIAIGLLFAVVPRLINLTRVWITGRDRRVDAAMPSFWLNLFAIAAAIVNAFVHSRDAYGVMPLGLWLSVLTVVLLILARAMPSLQRTNAMVTT